jgi:hypothetical protein
LPYSGQCCELIRAHIDTGSFSAIYICREKKQQYEANPKLLKKFEKIKKLAEYMPGTMELL